MKYFTPTILTGYKPKLGNGIMQKNALLADYMSF